MLNSDRVLKYVKSNLGFPFLQVELSDMEILDYIKEFTIREFSYYVPEKKKLVLNTNIDAVKVPGIKNEYYLTDPEGVEILNVISLISPLSNLMINGHPPIGPYNIGDLREFALDVHNAMMFKQFSNWDYTFEFTHPNIIRISPAPNISDPMFTIEYERMQSNDFRGIPNDLQQIFLNLCLADIAMPLHKIRTKYRDIKTPFGEIPLDAESLTDLKDRKRDIIDKLEAKAHTNLIVDFG